MNSITSSSFSTPAYATVVPSPCISDPFAAEPLFSNSFISGLIQALVVTVCGLVISEIMGLMKNSPYRGILNMVVEGLLTHSVPQRMSLEAPSLTGLTTAFSPVRTEASTLLRQPATVSTCKSIDLSDSEP
jgi:hypothetical protein